MMRVSIIIVTLWLVCLGGSGVLATEPVVTGAAEVQQTLLTSPAAATCGPSPLRVVTTCEVGAGFLCVDTPLGGTTAEQITISGLIDRVNHTFAGLKVAVQHDQTKSLREIDVRDVVAADGSFHVAIPLPQLGAYTVVVQALRAQGDPVIERVALSRVIAPQAAQATVTLTPDPQANAGTIIGPSLTVGIDLLPQCEQCDYLGSATGGTLITIHNTITTPSGATQLISRKTDLGADGQFSLCVPVRTGTNRLDIYACNAATGFDLPQCAQLTPLEFTGNDGSVRIALVEPKLDQQSLFDQSAQATIPIRFRVEGLSEHSEREGEAPAALPLEGALLAPVIDETTECVNAVTLTWNRDEPIALCPTADGVYETTVQPQVGINVGVITAKGKTSTISQSLTLGWGAVRSPWDTQGNVIADAQRWERDTLLVGVRQQFMAESVRAIINHVARSDQVSDIIQHLVDAPVSHAPASSPSSTASTRTQAMDNIRATIPHCDGGGSLPGVRLELVEPPQIGNLEITRVAFSEDTMQLDVVADKIAARVKIYRDADQDGVADGIAIPLKIAFERIALYPLIRLQRGAEPLVLLTAATTHCAYQDDDYCSDRPAVVIPQNFVGDATTAGGFVICDHEGQAVDDAIAEGCAALNVVNSQTGLLSAQVLAAINEMAYCTGSSALTYFLREGANNFHVVAGCGASTSAADPDAMTITLPTGDCEDPSNPMAARRYDIPLGFDLVHSLMHVGADGMSAHVASRAGNAAYFRTLPDAVHAQRVGYLTEADAPQTPQAVGVSGPRDLALGVSETLLNQLFFLLGLQGDAARGTGPLDWDLHTAFFDRVGFDFTRECDEFDAQASGEDAPPALCQLRPRVKEIFGNSLSTYEYFPPNHPLLLRLRGSRRLMPHVRFFRANVPDQIGDDGQVVSWRDAQFVDLQIPDLELSIYALQTDPAAGLDAYGNPRVAVDAQGHPLIQSMRPTIADPSAGPIVRARMTLKIPLEVGALRPNPDDPSELELTFRTNSDLTQLVFTVAPGDNSTIIPDGSLLSNLREKLLTGVSTFAAERDALRVPLPKHFLLPHSGSESLWTMLGIQEFRLAKDGLAVGVDPGQDFLSIDTSFYLTQRLVIGGELIEWTIPEE